MVFLQKPSHKSLEIAPKVGAQAPTLRTSMKTVATHTPPVNNEPPRLLARLPTVLQATGLGRSTIYRLIADGSFPAPVRLGPRAVAWRWSDLDQWTRSRPGTH